VFFENNRFFFATTNFPNYNLGFQVERNRTAWALNRVNGQPQFRSAGREFRRQSQFQAETPVGGNFYAFIDDLHGTPHGLNKQGLYNL
jgi:hypothetical protein